MESQVGIWAKPNGGGGWGCCQGVGGCQEAGKTAQSNWSVYICMCKLGATPLLPTNSTLLSFYSLHSHECGLVCTLPNIDFCQRWGVINSRKLFLKLYWKTPVKYMMWLKLRSYSSSIPGRGGRGREGEGARTGMKCMVWVLIPQGEKELHIKWCQIAEQQLHNQIIPWNQALSQVEKRQVRCSIYTIQPVNKHMS